MTFWKPGTAGPGAVERDIHKEGEVVYAPSARVSIREQRLALPISQYRTQILYLVETSSVVVIVGHTGCGKTTQIPQYLHESGWTHGGRTIACTQPRRVAATTVASRVSEEMGCVLGRDVGYSVRFDECCDPAATRIKYMTDGMLVRECMLDPLLSKYSVVMVDEAHERSVHTDILLGLLKKIQRRRKDIRIIVSSATLNAQDFQKYYSDSHADSDRRSVSIISVEGQLHPVDILYTEVAVPDYVKATIELVELIHNTRPPGDILVFLTGQEEIEEACRLLNESSSTNLWVLPIFSGLSRDEQVKVFQQTPVGSRKIVVATNIAESSITIDGIVYVVDCGFVKQRFHNPITGVEMLPVVPCSKASLAQRSGRAGRVRSGVCFRLMTEAMYSGLADNSIPDIQRVNLAPVILQLKALGVDDVLHFDYMSPPPHQSMSRALDLLYSLGCLDDNAKLTPTIGTYMAEFPVDPMMARMILASGEMGCSEECVIIGAMLAVEQIFTNTQGKKIAGDRARRRFAVHEGDHLTYYNVYKSFESVYSKIGQAKAKEWANKCGLNYRGLCRAREIRNQLKKYCQRFHVGMSSATRDTKLIRKAIVAGYFSHAATFDPTDGTYVTVRDTQKLWIHPNSAVFRYPPQAIIYHEVMRTDKLYARDVTAIDIEWLFELAPHFYEKTSGVEVEQVKKVQKIEHTSVF